MTWEAPVAFATQTTIAQPCPGCLCGLKAERCRFSSTVRGPGDTKKLLFFFSFSYWLFIPLRLMQIADQGKKLNVCPPPLKLLISLFPRSVTFH